MTWIEMSTAGATNNHYWQWTGQALVALEGEVQGTRPRHTSPKIAWLSIQGLWRKIHSVSLPSRKIGHGQWKKKKLAASTHAEAQYQWSTRWFTGMNGLGQGRSTAQFKSNLQILQHMRRHIIWSVIILWCYGDHTIASYFKAYFRVVYYFL